METDGRRWVEAWENSLQAASIFSMKLEARPLAEREERREEKVEIAVRRVGEYTELMHIDGQHKACLKL